MKPLRRKLKIRKGATVEVIAGKDKSLSGKVLEIDSGDLKIKVQGVNIQTHFDREEGLQTKEGFIDYSNVKLIEQAPDKKKTKKKAAKSASK